MTSNYQSILQTLIRFPTISSESNLNMVTWIENYLKPYNVYCERIEDKAAKYASLLIRIGPENEGGLVFSGHMDVVPVASQPWTHDPFDMLEKDGKLFGRGSCDMKGYIACVLANLSRWSKLKLKRPIFFAFSYDEEVGCDKAPELIERLKAIGGENAWVLIGEPTNLNPVVGQKGIVNVKTVVKGKAAHSSQILSQGISAVHAASKMIVCLEQIMTELIATGTVDKNYNIPYSSIHAGIIHGGIAENVLAEDCTIQWEIRNLPSQNILDVFSKVEAQQAILKKENSGLEFKNEFTTPLIPSLDDRNNDDLLSLVMRCLPENSEKGYVAYATEAGHFQTAGFQTIILGPGSITQAHQADEWVEISQLERCYRLLNQLVTIHCGK